MDIERNVWWWNTRINRRLYRFCYEHHGVCTRTPSPVFTYRSNLYDAVNLTTFFSSPSFFGSEKYADVLVLFRSRTFFFFRTSFQVELFGNDLLKPFDISVWIALVVTIALFIIGFKVMQNYHQNDTMENSSPFIMTFGAYCQQGSLWIYYIYRRVLTTLGNCHTFFRTAVFLDFCRTISIFNQFRFQSINPFLIDRQCNRTVIPIRSFVIRLSISIEPPDLQLL